MTAAVHFAKVHFTDYDQQTAHLSLLEDGVYWRLIRRCLATEKPLPLSLTAIYRLVRAYGEDEQTAVTAMLAEFFEKRRDGWHHAVCEATIAEYRARSSTNSQNASKRWGSQRDNANAMRPQRDDCATAEARQGEGNSNQQPSPSSHKPPTTKAFASGDLSPALASDASGSGTGQQLKPETGFRYEQQPQQPPRRAATTPGFAQAADLADRVVSIGRPNGAGAPA